MTRRALTKSECIAESRKYKTAKEFRERSNQAYNTAYRNGWLRKFTWLPFAHRVKWTEESCRKAAMKYRTLDGFMHGKDQSAYNASLRNGWLGSFTWLRRKTLPHGTWTEDSCRVESRKYSTRDEFRKGAPVAYGKARENGWLDSYTWLERPRCAGLRKHAARQP